MLTRRDFSKLLRSWAAALGSGGALNSAKSVHTTPKNETELAAAAPDPQTRVANEPVQDMDPWRTRIPANIEQADQFEVWERTLQTGLKYDLLIKGGTVIDPGQRLHGVMDVAVKNSKISRVAPNIPADQASRVVNASGKLVTPGWIDLHVHCYNGVTFGVNVDHYCVGRGTTTVIEAGSTGYLGIGQFVKDIVNTSLTRVFALVHIVPVGDTTMLNHLLDDMKNISPQWTAMAAAANRPAVVGVKVHLSTVYSTSPKDTEMEVLKRALEAAEGCRMPLMVHIDQTYYPLPMSLKML